MQLIVIDDIQNGQELEYIAYLAWHFGDDMNQMKRYIKQESFRT